MVHRISTGINDLVEGIKSRICVADDDENFLDTPERVLRMYHEFVAEPQELEKELELIFKRTFPTSYSGQIIWPDISAFSLCPHHLVPVEYLVTIGYHPSLDEGRVTGLSKPVRLARLLACQPFLQETYTQTVAETILNRLSANGVACITRGVHGCMRFRGVKTDKPVIMSTMIGDYLTNPVLRSEFFDLLKLYR